jgi:hypothetical protein
MLQLRGTAMIPVQHWMLDQASREYSDVALNFLAD